MVHAEILLTSIIIFGVLGLVSAIYPYQVRIDEKKRVLWGSKKPRGFI